MNVKSYIVGGYIRDKILNVESNDIDVTVEGDGIQFASELNKFLKGALELHPDFKTASIKTDEYLIDIVSARKEYYIHPGALPKVEFADITEDIKRRDFTINMLAFDIANNKLLDLYNGIDDINKKVIRVVHNMSFIDDPTRIFRALRYSGRLNFKIEPNTERLMIQSIADGYINNISSDRIMNEIYLILLENEPETIIEKMKFYSIDKEIFKEIKINSRSLNTLIDDGNLLLYRFILMFYYIDKAGLNYICERYNLKSEFSNSLNCLIELRGRLKLVKNDNILIYNIFKDKRIEILKALYIMENEDIKKAIDIYLKKLMLLKLEVDGNDIMKLGLKPSPIYKIILSKIFNNKLSGKIRDKKDELNLLKIYVEKVKRGESIWTLL